jgi:TM2 domain-containing membrane protein YozV
MPAAPQPRPLDPLAAFLSYLLPGLGQILQGRIAKGLLFFVSLYSLFFYGMAMGAMKNVWLPPAASVAQLPNVNLAGVNLPGVTKSLAYRPQFLGQFWIGAAAWPAVIQYLVAEPDNAQANGLPIVGKFMATPNEQELQQLQRNGNKRWDLGWVYTLIAGVLNLLVIYDALAGPAIPDDDDDEPTATPPPQPVTDPPA